MNRFKKLRLIKKVKEQRKKFKRNLIAKCEQEKKELVKEYEKMTLHYNVLEDVINVEKNMLNEINDTIKQAKDSNLEAWTLILQNNENISLSRLTQLLEKQNELMTKMSKNVKEQRYCLKQMSNEFKN